jgi:hypothetical protein
VSRQQNPVDVGGNLEMAGDPFGGHQGGDGDGQYGDLRLDADPWGQFIEHLAQSELGKPTGDEQDAWRGISHVVHDKKGAVGIGS